MSGGPRRLLVGGAAPASTTRTRHAHHTDGYRGGRTNGTHEGAGNAPARRGDASALAAIIDGLGRMPNGNRRPGLTAREILDVIRTVQPADPLGLHR